VFQHLYFVIFLTILSFFLGLFYQRTTNRRIFQKPESFFCISCERKFKEKNGVCDCGGEIVSDKEVEWIVEN
jgi:rRNA maturation endonuclease Nob1